MPHQKRSSISSVFSNTSSSTTSSSQPSSTSVTRPSSFALSMPLTPEAMEDEGDEPFISIGPEMIDDNPFDPSLPDEVYFDMMKMRRMSSQVPTPGSSIYERLSRMVPSHSMKAGNPEQRNANGTWRSRFRLRRQSSEGQVSEGSARQSLSQRLEAVPEPGVVLSCNFKPKAHWGLVPLDAAQGRSDIVRRPEGFEMDEQRRSRLSR
ncbi:hypothetical protein EIP86_006731 [Pleurotus ostreatoroseus]|nr:hypothetical protein EIP86_006731 [Pleurotus ostreatoroseus]